MSGIVETPTDEMSYSCPKCGNVANWYGGAELRCAICHSVLRVLLDTGLRPQAGMSRVRAWRTDRPDGRWQGGQVHALQPASGGG